MMLRPGLALPLALVPALLALAPRAAAAGPGLTCAQATADTVDVDGMLDDWDGVGKARAGGTDRDASFDVRCLYLGDKLAISVDVRDERVVRAKGKGGDDRLELTLAAGGAPLTFALLPGVDKIAPRRTLGGKAVPAGVTVEDTLQEKGWSAELVVPLARVAGWGPSVTSLTLAVRLADADVAQVAATEHEITWDGALVLGNAAGTRDQLLRAAGLATGDLTLDVAADVDPTSKGPERVLAGGDVVAVLGGQYGFVHLPVERAADVLKVELVDLRGDGTKLVAAELRQRGGGGARTLLTLWAGAGGQLHQVRAIELGRERGDSRLRSTWTVEPAKKWKQAKGARRVLVVRAQPAVGWDEDSYAEATATDAEPIHVPWDDDRAGGLFWLDGDDLRAAPITR